MDNLRKRVFGGTEMPADGEYVDMGNGVLWATSNLTKEANGTYKLADNPWDFGAYFSWGDTEGHNVAGQNEGYNFSPANYSNGVSGSGHNLTASFSSGNATYDAARAKLGDSWRMPTKAEYDWLLNTSNCTNERVINYEGSSVAGMLFTSKVNGNKLFFPAAGLYSDVSLNYSGARGYYWSTEFYSSSSAYCVLFDGSSGYMYDYYRNGGSSVRPVTDPIIPSTGYTIDQSDPTASPSDYIIKETPSMYCDDQDTIHQIWSNTKLYAAKTALSSGKLQVRELSRNNKSKWVNGTDVTNNTTYDKFMKLPEFWWRCEEIPAGSNKWSITFTMTNPNSSLWNHWDGNTFIGVYEAYISGGLVYSRARHTPTGSVTWPKFRAYAAARGAGYSLVTYEAHQIMALLGYGWLGTTDDQSIVGYGGNEYNKVTGKCDAKGIHDTSAAVDGGNTARGGSNISINFWGLENWWGNMFEWVDNIETADPFGLVNILTPGSSTVNRTVQTTKGIRGCISKTVMGDKGDMMPKACMSDSTYSKGYASIGYVNTSAWYVACRSGSNSYADGGLGFLSFSDTTSYSNDSIGSRLLYHGDWEETNSLT